MHVKMNDLHIQNQNLVTIVLEDMAADWNYLKDSSVVTMAILRLLLYSLNDKY